MGVINSLKTVFCIFGFTQEQLAEKLNISTRHLQRIEKDEAKTTIAMLQKVCTILQIPDENMAKIFHKKEEQKEEMVP